MIGTREAAHVTRHEFYGGLASVWFFIMILIGRLPSTSTNYLFLAAAALIFVGCLVQILRARLSRENDTHEAA